MRPTPWSSRLNRLVLNSPVGTGRVRPLLRGSLYELREVCPAGRTNQRWYPRCTVMPSVRVPDRGFCYRMGEKRMEHKNRRTGTLCVFLAAVLYSIGGLCIKLIPWGGMAINGARTAIALVVIGGYLAVIRHPLRFNRWVAVGR